MTRPVRNAYRLTPCLCSFTLVLIAAATVQGQQKPAATWADINLDNKVVAKDVAKDTAKPAPPLTITPKKQKSIWREPAWYVAIGGSALDIAGSIASVDGQRVSEGNALFRRSDGNVAWARLLPVKAASLFLQYKAYKNPKHRKLAIVSMLAVGILQGTLGGARGLAMR